MRTIVALCFLLGCCLAGYAQVDTGIPSHNATFPVSAYESVNLGNLNILLQAPVRSKGGPIPLRFMLTANSQIYVDANKVYRTTASSPSGFFSNGATLAQGYWEGAALYTQAQGTCNLSHATIYTFTGIVDGNGTVHGLTAVWNNTAPCNTPIDTFAGDGSGYELTINSSGSAIVYDPHGNAASFAFTNIPVTYSGAITDSHGSTVTVAHGGSPNFTVTYTDPLTSTSVISFPSQQPSGTAIAYQYTDGTGTTRSVTANFLGGTSGTTFNPAYSCSGLINGSGPIYPLSSISFPDSSSLSLTWELASTGHLDGRIATVQIPTGATFTHSYSGGTNGDGLWCASTSVSNATLSINNGTGTWKFARVITTAGCPTGGAVPPVCSTTTLTKPDNSVTVYTLINNIITSQVVKDTDGNTVLDTMDWCYDSTISTCNTSAPSPNPTWVRQYHYVPGITNPAEVDTNFDTQHGNILEKDLFDFGPTIVTKRITSFGSWNGTSCVSMSAAHIYNEPCDVQIKDGSSNVLAHSQFNYNTSTGDLLNTYSYTGPSTFLTASASYNSNGTLASATGVDGVQTTFGNSQCNSLLPDHATNAIGTVSATWDCNGAVPLTTADLNGLVTTMTYGDPLYRVTQVSDSGGQAPVVHSYTGSTRTETSMTFNSNASIADTTTTLNSLGQVLAVQHRQSPGGSNYDTVSFAYDTSGHRTGVSQACSTTLGATCPTMATNETFDGANRPKTHKVLTSTNGVLTYTYPNGDINITLTPAPIGENAKSAQIELDGLGRTTRSCAITGLTGSGSCGQRSAGSGYLTKYTLDALGRATQVSRNAQTGGTPVNSSFTFDFLSRVTQQTIPETGTTSLVYDIVPTACSSFAFIGLPGHLAQTTDNAGNVLCYGYNDYPGGVSGSSAGRLGQIWPVSGPNLSVSPSRQFSYGDGHANQWNRLWIAGTAFPPYTQLIADVIYSHDVYGRVIEVQQSSEVPLGIFFTTTASYFDNGALQTLGGIPGVSDFTYTIDGEGRPTGASSGATSIVSSVAYDPASSPTTITYANGDKDTYQFDPSSRNMTQFKFTVGSGNVTDTGTPTWNPNGTLQQLVIADNLSSSDSQTCPVGHDDLARISSFNCGTLWSETYAYSPDYAGNVTKSGSLSFNPGYTPANNRMLSPYTYDAKGNMLHDGTLGINYTWDAYRRLATYAGHSVRNDAFGNMIENSVSPKQYSVYSPVGKLGLATSATAKLSMRIPLPGGSSIMYDSAGNEQINHLDFTGSTRLITNRVARTFVSAFCYGPMGEVYCGTAASSQYEGTFQDTTTGLDDFDAAHYSGAQGRSISPTGGANGYVKTNSPF
jgi:hypothetical protein